MIILENVSKKFGTGVFAISDINLSIEKGEFVLAIPPHALSTPTTISFTFEELTPATTPPEFIPSVWSVHVAMDPSVTVLRPLTIVMRSSPQGLEYPYYPFIHRWDEARVAWQYVPTALSWRSHEVRAQITGGGQYAILYDNNHDLYGRATWYADRLSKDSRLAAASNQYPLGAKLKVTNVETQESVVVTVQSTGPYIKGRVLDLTHTAFSKIGYPRKQGVLSVVIEPLGHPAFEYQKKSASK